MCVCVCVRRLERYFAFSFFLSSSLSLSDFLSLCNRTRWGWVCKISMTRANGFKVRKKQLLLDVIIKTSSRQFWQWSKDHRSASKHRLQFTKCLCSSFSVLSSTILIIVNRLGNLSWLGRSSCRTPDDYFLHSSAFHLFFACVSFRLPNDSSAKAFLLHTLV